ncbi:MAG: hypothetical protein LBT14_09850 [Treponema sp.]|jgi:hypothetical protein|nr:hypothetical protein [Treponema sp.]
MKKTAVFLLLVSTGFCFAQENGGIGTVLNTFGVYFAGYLPTDPQVLSLPFGDPVQALDMIPEEASSSPVMIQIADGGDPDWLARPLQYGKVTYEKDSGTGLSA